MWAMNAYCRCGCIGGVIVCQLSGGYIVTSALALGRRHGHVTWQLYLRCHVVVISQRNNWRNDIFFGEKGVVDT